MFPYFGLFVSISSVGEPKYTRDVGFTHRPDDGSSMHRRNIFFFYFYLSTLRNNSDERRLWTVVSI